MECSTYKFEKILSTTMGDKIFFLLYSRYNKDIGTLFRSRRTYFDPFQKNLPTLSKIVSLT